MSTSSSSSPTVVFGGTGVQGAPVVDALLRQGRPVRAVARTAGNLERLADRGAETAVVDLADRDAVRRVLEGASGAFIHLPFIPVPELIEAWSTSVAAALRDTGVPAVFTLSGPAALSPLGIPSFDTKALAKEILSAERLPLIGLEPMSYLGNLSAFSAYSVVSEGELRYPLPATHRQPWISTQDQAALALAALERPDLQGRWFRVGEQLTGPELAAGIAEGRGHSVSYVELPLEEFRRLLAPVLGEETAAAVVEDYRGVAARPEALDLDTTTTHQIHRELGVPATSIAEWARAEDWHGAAETR